MKKQYIARRSLSRGAAQAIRLNAARVISPSVLNATFHLTAENAERGSLQSRHASIDFMRGQLIIRRGETFFLVESSKFAGRFYVLVQRNGRWISSSDDARVTAQLVERVHTFQPAMVA